MSNGRALARAMNKATDKPQPRSLAGRVLGSDDLLAEAVKIMLTGLTCALWVLGYAYVNAFYGMFGISVAELDLTLFEYIFRGLFFLVSPDSALRILGILVVFTIVMLLALNSKRLFIEVPLYLLAFAFVLGSSVALGNAMAALQVSMLESGNYGKQAQCILKPDETVAASAAVNAFIESSGVAGNLRFIEKTKLHHHFMVIVGEKDRDRVLNDKWVKSYAIPNDSVVFCTLSAPLQRSVGSFRE